MLDPLVFEPYFRPQVWGHQRLASILGKPLPAGARIGESWEVSGHPHHFSRVAAGPWAGRSLAELWADERRRLMGVDAPEQFPLLVKFLDCHEPLSVQVHPSDEFAAQAASRDSGKTEAWFVVRADPGARIYAGFQAGVTRREVEQRLAAGTLPECLHSFEPRAGQAVFVPAGIVHALGGGVLLAEVQQSSDATYRLFDWNRVGLDSRPRELQIDLALAAIDWQAGPVHPIEPSTIAGLEAASVARLVDCDYFTWNRWELSAPLRQHGGHIGIWMVVGGQGRLHVPATGYDRIFTIGETVLIPADCRGWIWEPAGLMTAVCIAPKAALQSRSEASNGRLRSPDSIAA